MTQHWSILYAPKAAHGCDLFWNALLSRHWVKELGQNWLTSRNCHSQFLFLWQIFTDILVILPMNHGTVTKSPHTTLPKEGKSHWKSKFTALLVRQFLSFWFPKGLAQGEYTTIITTLLSPAQSMRYSHSAPLLSESIWTAFSSFRNP